jgi:hypothetical protein
MTLFGAVIGLATTLTAFVLRKSRTAAAVNRRAGRLKATLLEE